MSVISREREFDFAVHVSDGDWAVAVPIADDGEHGPAVAEELDRLPQGVAARPEDEPAVARLAEAYRFSKTAHAWSICSELARPPAKPDSRPAVATAGVSTMQAITTVSASMRKAPNSARDR